MDRKIHFSGVKSPGAFMWLLKVILFVCLFNLVNLYAGPKDYGIKVYKHIIEVSDITLDTPVPLPNPIDDGGMVARGFAKYKTVNYW
jgi:hypothetical protein